MESQYTISQAKNRLPAIVHSVEKGPSKEAREQYAEA
jgi:hypothetical protein